MAFVAAAAARTAAGTSKARAYHPLTREPGGRRISITNNGPITLALSTAIDSPVPLREIRDRETAIMGRIGTCTWASPTTFLRLPSPRSARRAPAPYARGDSGSGAVASFPDVFRRSPAPTAAELVAEN